MHVTGYHSGCTSASTTKIRRRVARSVADEQRDEPVPARRPSLSAMPGAAASLASATGRSRDGHSHNIADINA